MLPMSDGQIERFAEWRGLNDVAAFLAEVGRQDAWIFARRPLDLGRFDQGLVEFWASRYSGRAA